VAPGKPRTLSGRSWSRLSGWPQHAPPATERVVVRSWPRLTARLISPHRGNFRQWILLSVAELCGEGLALAMLEASWVEFGRVPNASLQLSIIGVLAFSSWRVGFLLYYYILTSTSSYYSGQLRKQPPCLQLLVLLYFERSKRTRT